MAGNDLCFKIAGEAGQGINVSALTLSRAFTRKGFYAFLLTENPNSIKLEPAWCSLRISDQPIKSQTHIVDILIALKKESVLRHQPEVIAQGYILYDSESIKLEDTQLRKDLNYISLPLARIIKERKLPELLRNTVCIGAILALLEYDLAAMKEILQEQFQRKGDEVVRQNTDALESGFNFIKENKVSCKICSIRNPDKPARIFLTGNEALSLGAIKAGCKFVAAYPMTPSSPILHFMAAKEKEYNIVVKHTEDEIAAINMAIGASFAGARAMTCTSGGGFSLMSEALGLSAQSETPVVVVVGQRPGPSTGQPTHTSQGDLRFLIHASQGEFPRIVIAPGDTEECFYETFNAFNLAEKFQIPVLLLTDKYLVESYVTQDNFDLSKLSIDRGKLLFSDQVEGISDYKRYAFSEDGVSSRAIPGQKNCLHIATSYEHDEYGYYMEDPQGVAKMMDKRFAKLKAIPAVLPRPKLYGPQKADITLIAWGSTKGPVLEAMQMLEGEKIKVNFLHIVYIWPFPSDAVSSVIKDSKITLGIEGNKTAQMSNLIKQEAGLSLDYRYLKYNGQPFYPVDIYHEIKTILK